MIRPGQRRLKAIFQFGSVQTKQALNANTVTVITGTLGYLRSVRRRSGFPADMAQAAVASDRGSGSARAWPTSCSAGRRSRPSRADTLDYLEKKGFANDVKKQFTYVTKLYNEEMQVMRQIDPSLKDLEGKTVSVDHSNGGTFVLH